MQNSERLWKKAVVAKFKVGLLSWRLSGELNKKYNNLN